MNPKPSKDDLLEGERLAGGATPKVNASFAEQVQSPLAKFSGILSPEAADEMERAIEECCEQVALEEWNRLPLTPLDP